MAEEIKNEIKEEKKECRCSKDFKLLLITILGSFLGCLVALLLFTAATRPQGPAPCPQGQPPRPAIEAPMPPHGMGMPQRDFRQDKIKQHKGGERPDVKPPVKQEAKQ